MVIFRTTVPPLVCIFVALVLAAVFVLVAVPLVLHVVEASTLKLELTKLLVGSSASDPVLHVVTLPTQHLDPRTASQILQIISPLLPSKGPRIDCVLSMRRPSQQYVASDSEAS
jgi:hypothetical protein